MANLKIQNEKLKISVVTISFNQVRFIEQCLLSVLQQNYSNIEYIVVDAGSTDGSRKILNKYRKQITHVVFEEDEGPADGLNKGFSYATGDVFFYLNSDDFLLPDALNTICNQFLTKDIDVLFGHAVMVDVNSKKIRNLYTTPWNTNAFILGENPIVQPATSFKGSIFKATSGFNKKNRTCWDGELIADISCLTKKIGYVDKLLSAFRLYDESISGSGSHYDEFVETRTHYVKKLTPTLDILQTPYLKYFFVFYYKSRKFLYRLRSFFKLFLGRL